MRFIHRALLEHAPPTLDIRFDALAPSALLLAMQLRQQRAQRVFAVAEQIQLHRIAQAQHSAIDIDLDATRLPFLRQEFRVGKCRADHQQRVALRHEIPARLGAEQTDRSGDERQIVGHGRLAEQRLCDSSAQKLCRFDQFLAGMQRTGAGQNRHLLAVVEDVRCALQVLVRRDALASWTTHTGMNRAVRARRRLDSIERLQVVRHDNARHRALVEGDAHRTIDEVAHLLRHDCGVNELARDILEERFKIHFLLVVAADRRARLLPDDCQHGLMVQLRVVKTVE